MIALLATSLGQRFALVRQHGARMIAVFAIVSAVVVSLGGMSMTLEWSLASGRLDVIPVSAFVVVPLFLVGLQARRGLRLVRA